jgi:hypothetical protein
LLPDRGDPVPPRATTNVPVDTFLASSAVTALPTPENEAEMFPLAVMLTVLIVELVNVSR